MAHYLKKFRKKGDHKNSLGNIKVPCHLLADKWGKVMSNNRNLHDCITTENITHAQHKTTQTQWVLIPVGVTLKVICHGLWYSEEKAAKGLLCQNFDSPTPSPTNSILRFWELHLSKWHLDVWMGCEKLHWNCKLHFPKVLLCSLFWKSQQEASSSLDVYKHIRNHWLIGHLVRAAYPCFCNPFYYIQQAISLLWCWVEAILIHHWHKNVLERPGSWFTSW